MRGVHEPEDETSREELDAEEQEQIGLEDDKPTLKMIRTQQAVEAVLKTDQAFNTNPSKR